MEAECGLLLGWLCPSAYPLTRWATRPAALGWDVPGSRGPPTSPPAVAWLWGGSERAHHPPCQWIRRFPRPLPQGHPPQGSWCRRWRGSLLAQGGKPGPRAAGAPSGDLPHQGSVLPPSSPLSVEPAHKDAGGSQEPASSPEVTPTETLPLRSWGSGGDIHRPSRPLPQRGGRPWASANAQV